MGGEIFGRDEELSRIADFVRAVPTGPSAFLLAGDAGIGKSILFEHALAASSAAGYCVLSCRPGEREADLSYAGLSDLVGSVADEMLVELPAPQKHALAVALLREATTTGPPIERRAVAEATRAALDVLAKSRPLVIAVDDVQWLDAPSKSALEFVFRRRQREAIGVLLTLRTPPLDVPLGIDRAFTAEALTMVQLEPLSLGAIYHVVRSRLGASLPRSVLVELHRSSNGNPFFALEITRALLASPLEGGFPERLPIPATVKASIEHRLAALPRRTRDILLIASALPRPTVAVLCAVADAPEHLDADLERASREGLLVLEGEHVRFSHPLVAAVTYESVSDSKRRELHRRLASVVEDIEERAHQLALGALGPDAELATTLEKAAARARARGAVEVAAALLEQAHELTPEPRSDDALRRTSEAAMCHYLSGQTERAHELWEQTLAIAAPGPLRAEASWRLAEFRHSSLDLGRQVAVAEQALEEAQTNVALRAQIHHTLALSLLWGGDVRKAASHARTALLLAEQREDPTALAMALTAVAWVEHASAEGPSEELLERCLGLEDTVRGLPVENSPALARAMMTADVGERPDFARREFARLRRQAEDWGLEVSLPLLLYEMSDLERRAGDWLLADRYAAECEQFARQTEQLFRLRLAYCAQSMLAACRGELDEARALVGQGLELASGAGPWIVDARLRVALGFVELSSGSPKAAHQCLAPIVEQCHRGGYNEPTFVRALPDDIDALVELGDLDAAALLLEGFEAQAARSGHAWALATAARCRGMLAAAGGDLPGAERSLEVALAQHQRLPDPFERARTLLTAGNVCRRARRKLAAQEHLEQAMAIFDGLGAVGWSERARLSLRRIGLRTSSRDQLSPTEERVAMLVASGRTNKEIAQALFVSVKAVEASLTRAYAKLGVRSRTELALELRAKSRDSPISSSRARTDDLRDDALRR